MTHHKTNKTKTWGVLVGSKRKLRKILTGEAPPDNLADDLLYGAQNIAEFTGLNPGQVYHQRVALGLTRLGATRQGQREWHAEKATSATIITMTAPVKASFD
jgi:hypothetical protein